MSGRPVRRTGEKADGKQRQSPAEKPGLGARVAAAKLLAAVVDRQTSLDGLLDPEGGNPAYLSLSPSDQALVRAILLVTLRHLPRIDHMIDARLDRPLPEGARALRHVLRVAVSQIAHLSIPDHSAVDLAVEAARQDPRNRRFASLVNAVLRAISRNKAEALANAAAVPAAPPWFAERLVSLYGEAEATAILEAHLVEPPLDLTVKGEPGRWAARLDGIVLPTGSVRLRRVEGPVTDLPGFQEGAWWVQDAAASIPAQLFDDLKARVIADLCAAPGGKTAQLAAAGARVTAFDLSKNRLKRLEGNLARLGLSAECLAGDFMKEAQRDRFDGVLLDAPCSSTGTVRRHPDVPWTKGPQDIEKLAALQERMLRHAATLVKPGGRIVFSNCSLDRREGEDVVARILADTPNLVLLPVEPGRWPGLEEAIRPDGMVRTTPAMLQTGDAGTSGMDGFFAAVLVRQG